MDTNRKIALITGISGQDGPYLALQLLGCDFEVVGVDRIAGVNSGLEEMDISRRVEVRKLDVTNKDEVNDLIDKLKPDHIYHLAALSNVPSSWEDPYLTTKINCEGTLNILEAVKKFSPKSRIFHAASGEIFGDNTNHTLENTSQTLFSPSNPYSITKLYGFWMGKVYAKAYGIYFVNGIFHNHESPLRPPIFVTRKISQAVARIFLGHESELTLGDLDARRDWGFAGDYMEAAYLSLMQEKGDDYIIATGQTHSVKDFVREAFKAVGIADWEKYVKIDAKFVRPTETTVVSVDISKTQKQLKWQSKVDFASLVTMMVEADIKRLKY